MMIIQTGNSQDLATWWSRVEVGHRQEAVCHSGPHAKAGQRTGLLKPAFFMDESEHGRSQSWSEKEGIN